MAKKYPAIIDAAWAGRSLQAESVPHLLHWDLAYLWMLEKVAVQNATQVPDLWQRRLGAWRHLLGLFVTGGVRVEEESIKQPLLGFTEPYGVTTVRWLVAEGRRIGVESPTVLVRPLPDFEPEDQRSWPADPSEVSSAEVAHFVGKVVSSLEDIQPGQTTFARRLGAVLRNQFDTTPLPDGLPGRDVTAAVLRDLRWTQGDGPAPFDEVTLFISDAREGEQLFVPRCPKPNCNGTLTHAPGEVVRVGRDASHVNARCSGCGEEAPLDLADLQVWNRPGHDEVVLWTKSGQVPPPRHGQTPTPLVIGHTVRFTWNPGLVSSPDQNMLSLEFTGQTISEKVPVSDAFYSKLLVPGDPDAFSGLPVKGTWRDSLTTTAASVAPKVQGEGPSIRVAYEGLRIAGWPDPITWVYTGDASVEHVPDVHVGVFPDPGQMPPSWKWYRTFLSDPSERTELVADGEQVLPRLVETEEGAPATFAVQSGVAGVSYAPDWPTGLTGGAVGRRYVGLDFGTTNTIAYALTETQKDEEPSPNEHGLRPDGFGAATKWMTGLPPRIAIAGGFLPGPAFETSGRDPYVTPTALWATPDAHVIRWNDEPPTPGATPETNFKLDVAGSAERGSALRKRFLLEYLLLALPGVVGSPERTAAPEVHLGIAFPLALTHRERREYAGMLAEVTERVRALTGVPCTAASIDEAQACVASFTSPNPGESYLIADMGGGTMDVALFTTGRPAPSYHQLGSVRYAGEAFVEAAATWTAPDVWRLRDIIRSGESRDQMGANQNVAGLRSRFYTYAFEFLRTMVAAFREEAGDQELRLVLVGNGWHLVEAFDPRADQIGEEAAFKEHYETLVDKIGDPHLVLHDVQFGYPSTKHLVVVGALRNVADATPKRELNNGAQLARIPAGRPIDFPDADGGRGRSISWHQLVGPGAPVPALEIDDVLHGSVDFRLTEAPPSSEAWTRQVKGATGAESPSRLGYPSEGQLRRQLRNNHQAGAGGVIFEKGPLQFVLEGTWFDSLKQSP